jgi:hypothetical protein
MYGPFDLFQGSTNSKPFLTPTINKYKGLSYQILKLKISRLIDQIDIEWIILHICVWRIGVLLSSAMRLLLNYIYRVIKLTLAYFSISILSSLLGLYQLDVCLL